MSIFAETPNVRVVIKRNVFMFFSDFVSHAKTEFFEQASTTSLSCIFSLLLHHLTCNNINENKLVVEIFVETRRKRTNLDPRPNPRELTHFPNQPPIAHVID
jgi:hypothetical protein